MQKSIEKQVNNSARKSKVLIILQHVKTQTQWIMNELVTSLEFLHFLVKNKSFVRLILYHSLTSYHKKHN